MLVDPSFKICFSVLFFVLSFLFSFFFDGKRQKKNFHAEINDFDQQIVCGAPVCWSKYTTLFSILFVLFDKKLEYAKKEYVIRVLVLWFICLIWLYFYPWTNLSNKQLFSQKFVMWYNHGVNFTELWPSY